MSLVDQIFEQIKAGGANNQPSPLAEGFLQGARMGQQQQQIDMQKKQLGMELQMLPLKQKLAEQDAALAQARTQSMLDDRDAEANAGLAFAALKSKVNPLMQAGKIEEAQNTILAETNAWLLADPKKRLHSLYDMTTKAQDAKLALIQAKQSQFMPELVTLTDKTTGKTYPVVRTGPHASQVMDPESAALRKEALDLRRQKLLKELPPESKMEAQSLYKAIDRKREQLDDKNAFPEETWSFGFPPKKVPNPKRAALEAEINGLHEQIKNLTGKDSESTTAPKFEEGAIYIDGNGNKATYRGGKFEPLP
jgi:hypothetical protein